MSRTESTMVALGTLAPPFELLDVLSGHAMSRDDVFAPTWDQNRNPGSDPSSDPGRNPGRDPKLSDAVNTATHGGPARRHGLLVMFLCPHCPYVKHLEAGIAALAQDYFGPGGNGPIAFAAIQSNDTTQYPEDGPEGMRAQASAHGWQFPYLLDETQEVARSYNAACTPDFFLFNGDMQLVYRGQFDRSRPRRGDFGNDTPVTGEDLRQAMDALIQGKHPNPNQQNSIGCNIKWRP